MEAVSAASQKINLGTGTVPPEEISLALVTSEADQTSLFTTLPMQNTFEASSTNAFETEGKFLESCNRTLNLLFPFNQYQENEKPFLVERMKVIELD